MGSFVPPAGGGGGGVAGVASFNARSGAVTLLGTDVNPLVTEIDGVTLAGVPAVGQVPTATSGAAATWQTPAAGGGVASFNTRTGAVVLTSGDVTTALGFTPFANPMTTVGDVIVGGAAGAAGRVAAGTLGFVFTSNGPGVAPSWQAGGGGGGGVTSFNTRTGAVILLAADVSGVGGILQGGNAFGAAMTIGPTDNNLTAIQANNQVGMQFLPTPETNSPNIQSLRLFYTPLENGKFDLTDFGSIPGHLGVVAADANCFFRTLRADGAGYLSRNAQFIVDKVNFTESWNRDDTTTISNLLELGAGIVAFYIAPAAANPISWTRAFSIALAPNGLTGNPYIGMIRTKVGDLTNPGTVNGWLEIIPTDATRPLYVSSGTGGVGSLFTSQGAALANIIDVLDGPDINNSNYVLFGPDPTGGTVGFASGGVFVSTGKNGTGIARPLVLHNNAAQPIKFATTSLYRGEVQAGGTLGWGGVSGTPNWSVDSSGLMHTIASNQATGSGSALLGANCPAVTATAPNTWIKVVLASGSTAFIPAWV